MALPPPADSSTALITGASSGIGAEIARELAARGHGVTLVARREERLTELAANLAEAHGIRAEVIAADLGEDGERDRLASELEARGLTVEILVNNAGFGDNGYLNETDRERVTSMVRLNCEALLDLQARFTPAMVERRRGAVINVASTASFQPLPGTATYAATKAFVLSLSEATHQELKPVGVTVTALCPGPTKTEFTDAAGIESAEERLPEAFWTSVESVARAGVEGAAKGRRVVVPGLVNRGGALAGQHSPRALALPVFKRLWRSNV